MKIKIWIIFLCYVQCLVGQNETISLTKIMHVKCFNQTEIPLVITNENALNELSLSKNKKDSILQNVDFKTENLIFLCFFHRFPSFCNKMYFEYYLRITPVQQTINIKIHQPGSLAARFFQSIVFKVSKTYSLNNLSIKQEYVPYQFGSQTQLDSICKQLQLKFKE